MKKIKEWLTRRRERRETEYSKRRLDFIIFNGMGMIWCSYILAWFGKNEIAETLSKTVVTAIIGVLIPYLVTKTIENVNKYGSKLNGTANPPSSSDKGVDNMRDL